MTTLSLALSFIFGTIIGSFLNVVSLRYNTGMGIGGRSRCFSCGKGLKWLELIPIASFMVQKGACKKCKTKISWQYPLVEFVSGALFVLILLKFPPVDLISTITAAIYLFITCIMVVITVYDMKHKIIPDPLVYAFDLIALVSVFMHTGQSLFWTLIAGPLCALPFALIWFFSKGKWMGLGDAKLVLGIGWLLGLSSALSAITLAFWIGAGVSVLWMFVRFGKLRGRFEVPFAPYLILGMYLVLIFGISVINIF